MRVIHQKLNLTFFLQFLCGFLHSYALLSVVSIFYTAVIQPKKRITEDPASLFTVVNNSMFSVALSVFLYICWIRRDGMVKIYRICHNVFWIVKRDEKFMYKVCVFDGILELVVIILITSRRQHLFF